MCLSAASQLIPAVSGAGLQGRLAKFLSLRHVLLPGTPRVQLRQHLSTSSVSQAMNTHGDRPCLATTPSDNAGREMALATAGTLVLQHSHTSPAPVCQSVMRQPWTALVTTAPLSRATDSLTAESCSHALLQASLQ